MVSKVYSPMLAVSRHLFDDDVPDAIARHAHWVRAEAVGDVEYRELGGLLRHPSWKGLRVDLADAAQVQPGIFAFARVGILCV
jgi:bifunctional non-homologous end joining protein LigD